MNLIDIASEAAGRVVRRFRLSEQEYDDLTQEGVLTLLNEPTLYQGASEAYAVWNLQRRLYRPAAKMKNRAMTEVSLEPLLIHEDGAALPDGLETMYRIAEDVGLDPDTLGPYNPMVVDLVLPAVWIDGYRPPALQEERVNLTVDRAHGFTWEIMVMDVRRAVEKLMLTNRRAYDILYFRYARGLTWTEAGEAIGISRATAYRVGPPALQFLSDILNGEEVE